MAFPVSLAHLLLASLGVLLLDHDLRLLADWFSSPGRAQQMYPYLRRQWSLQTSFMASCFCKAEILRLAVPQNHRAAPASLFRNILQPVSWCTWSQHYRRDGRWKLFTSVCYVDFSERILHRACFRKPQTLLHFLRSDQRLAHCIQPWTYIVLTSNDFFS